MKNTKKIINKFKKQYVNMVCSRFQRLREKKHHISIIQKFYECCVDYYIAKDADDKAMKLMGKYPELEEAYINRIEERLAHVEFPEETPEQAEERWQSICTRIWTKYTKDMI